MFYALQDRLEFIGRAKPGKKQKVHTFPYNEIAKFKRSLGSFNFTLANGFYQPVDVYDDNDEWEAFIHSCINGTADFGKMNAIPMIDYETAINNQQQQT